MDIQSIQMPLIFVCLFSIGSVLLIFIYKFGVKEKSYEEALAEQRQLNQALLGFKPKPKEKKVKKTSKKNSKDKLNIEENVATVDEPEAVELPQKDEALNKPHVEFKDADEDVPAKPLTNKKQVKKEKVQPILVHNEKKESSKQTTSLDEVQPKANLEPVKVANVKNEARDEKEKSKTENPTKVELETAKQIVKKPTETVKPTDKKENPPVVESSINGIINNTGKEKKKKKSEFNTLQQLASNTNNSTNITVLLNLVRKAELSRSEVQILIDLLLNKQHDAPLSDEWSEGKADAIQKLKKQLAEKEKLVVEQQEIVTSAQSKLREIRAEHQNEKSALQQKIRGVDELIHSKQAEMSRLLQQVQQLQNQIKEEVLKNHKLREEHAAIQMQRQQYEMRLGQVQETEVIMNQLQSQVQELSSTNNQMLMELARVTEEGRAEKERNQSLIVQLTSFQKELDQKNERNRQLEDSRLQLERDLESVLKQENDLKSEISRFNSVIQQQNEEIRRLEHGKKQYVDELQKNMDESNKLLNDLRTDLRHAQEENAQIQITHMNGSLQETKQYEVEILNLQNELSSVKTQLDLVEKKSEAELKTAAKASERLAAEVEELKTRLEEAAVKLEEQKSKNNVLRTKNWKVMEALNAAESRTKTNVTLQAKSDKDIEREFIQRLFPEIKDKQVTDSNVFKSEGENFVRGYVDSLRTSSAKESTDNSELVQLKTQLQHYKNVIDNAEKMLNKLQTHIEQEEINWRMQLGAKTAELEALKESQGGDLQERLKTLEDELKREQEDKRNLVAQFQKFKNNSQTVEFMLDAQNSSNGLH